MLCDSVPRMIPFFSKIGFFSTNDNENDNAPSWAMGGSHRAMAFVSPFDAISRQARYGPSAPKEHGVLGASPIAVRRCVLGWRPIAAAKKRARCIGRQPNSRAAVRIGRKPNSSRQKKTKRFDNVSNSRYSWAISSMHTRDIADSLAKSYSVHFVCNGRISAIFMHNMNFVHIFLPPCKFYARGER